MENGCQGWFNVEGGPMGDFLIGKGKFKQSAWDSYVGKVSQIRQYNNLFSLTLSILTPYSPFFPFFFS